MMPSRVRFCDIATMDRMKPTKMNGPAITHPINGMATIARQAMVRQMFPPVTAPWP